MLGGRLLAFLTTDDFAGITESFPLVGFNRLQISNNGGKLSDLMLINTADGQNIVFDFRLDSSSESPFPLDERNPKARFILLP
jgi:hypothetical protein